MKNFLKVIYTIIFLIIGFIILKNYNERYYIDIDHPMIYRIKSIPFDEYTDEYYLESMLDEERKNAESVWDEFHNGSNDDAIFEKPTSLDIEFERIFKPLRKERLNTIQKLILIEDYLLEYPDALSQLKEHLDYWDIKDVKDKIKESILSEIKTPNIIEIWTKEGRQFTEFDDTLDVDNYRKVDKLFDSLFRIYELKNNYNIKYGKKNYDRTFPIDSLLNLFK